MYGWNCGRGWGECRGKYQCDWWTTRLGFTNHDTQSQYNTTRSFWNQNKAVAIKIAEKNSSRKGEPFSKMYLYLTSQFCNWYSTRVNINYQLLSGESPSPPICSRTKHHFQLQDYVYSIFYCTPHNNPLSENSSSPSSSPPSATELLSALN